MTSDSPARADSAVDQLVRRLEILAVDELKPGMHLPSEADLGREYGLSRITVREALKVLAGRGLIELSRGRRSVVKGPDSSMLASQLGFAVRRDLRAALELMQVRQALEAQAATLAAGNASRAGIMAIEAALKGMVEASTFDSEEAIAAYHAADIAFHEALALASGNRMLAFILQGMEESLRDSFALSFEGHMATGGTAVEVIASHALILQEVRAGNAHGAARAVHGLLNNVERDLRGLPWQRGAASTGEQS